MMTSWWNRWLDYQHVNKTSQLNNSYPSIVYPILQPGDIACLLWSILHPYSVFPFSVSSAAPEDAVQSPEQETKAPHSETFLFPNNELPACQISLCICCMYIWSAMSFKPPAPEWSHAEREFLHTVLHLLCCVWYWMLDHF